MRHGISEFLAICTLALVSLLATNAAAVPALHEETFEGCTGSGYSLLSGYFGGDINDGIECGPTFSFTSQSGAVTGFQGSNYIAIEDIDDVGFTNPNAVVLSAVNISGATNLGISFLFAAPNATATRYEVTDILQVQYSVDSGPFVTVGSFRGNGNVGMNEDPNLDGSFPTLVSGLAMQRFSYSLNNRAGAGTVSGTSLVVRILFSSEGSQEEMMFDDIIISGTVAAVPIVNFAASTYSYNEDGTPVASDVTLTRSGSTAGAATINMTFSAGSASAPGDFTSTTTSVAFTAGQTTKTVSMPIIDDAIDENNETFTLGLAADGSGAVVGSTITSSTITIVDDDTADITVSESAVSVTEAGGTDTFTVVLETQPTANVGVDVSVGAQALVASGGSPAASVTLTFTSVNWATPQTVTVSAVNDVVVEANPHSETVSLTVDSTDLKYDGFALNDVSVSIAENDNCGDAFCNASESTATCPADCGSLCGDTACNGSETTVTCVADCGSSCGDTACNGAETTANCVSDCGSSCGDTVCNGAETTANCALDCGSSCGDTACNGAETTANCVSDCGSNCGDTACNGSETTANCVTDCGSSCGDTACNGSETTANCVTDCGSSCGDTVCNGSETTANCVVDCGSSCGDTAVNGPEVCDGLSLAGETCVSQGFDYGILLCNVNCLSFDTSGCNFDLGVDAGPDGGVFAEAGTDTATSEGSSSGAIATSGLSSADTSGADTSGPGTSGAGTSGAGTSGPGTSEEPTGELTSETGAVGTTSEEQPATTAPVETGGASTSGPEYTSEVGRTSETPVGSTTSGAVDTAVTDTSAPTVTGGNTAETGEGVTTSESYTSEVIGGGTSSENTAGSTTSEVFTEDTDVGNPTGPDTTEPDDTTGPSGPGGGASGGIVDAGTDAGPDAGTQFDFGDDGCDCRVGVRSQSSGTGWLALGLVGLALVRIRQRRKS